MSSQIRNYWLLLSLCLLMVACASKPISYSEKSVKLDLPEEWKVKHDASIDQTGWVKQLQDIHVQGQIDTALNNNPNLQSLLAGLKGQQLLVNIANREKKPGVELQLDATRDEVTKGSSSDVESLDLQLISTWEMDVWGRLSSAEKAAIWRQQAAKENFYFAKLSLAGQVAQLWLDAVQQQQLIDLNQQETESWLLSQQILESDYQEGVAAKTAVHLTQTQLALARANYHQLVQQRDTSLRQMLALQGNFPDLSTIKLPEQLPSVPQLSTDGLSMGTLEQRPDVKAAMSNLESLDAEASAAYRALYPQLKLTLTPRLVTNRLSNAGSPDRLLSSEISLLQPLFSRNSLLLQTRVAETESEQAYWQYVQTLLNASEEVTQGISNHQNLLDREKQLMLAREEAYLASSSANEDYQQGVGNVLDWLSLKRSFLTIEQQVIRNRADALKNWVSVHLALATPLNKIN